MNVYPHATDPPLWWCEGHFDPAPVAFVGVAHVASPDRRGWPVFRCLDCGDEIYHAPRPQAEAAKIAELAAVAL